MMSSGEAAQLDAARLPLTPTLSLKGRGSKAERRLRVRTLFTTSSPHSGALRAERWPTLLRMQGDMTAGSEFYGRLTMI